MEVMDKIDQKAAELLQLLDQLDPKTEADQLGRSLRLGLGLAKYKAKQRRKGEHAKHTKQD